MMEPTIMCCVLEEFVLFSLHAFNLQVILYKSMVYTNYKYKNLFTRLLLLKISEIQPLILCHFLFPLH
jgi:hypothetical protein